MVHRLLLVVLLVNFFVGCETRSDGPPRQAVKGKVKFQGAPVPSGLIRFSPDTRKGNHGPGATALIKDGQYITPPSKGAVSGPMIVYVEGFDGLPKTKGGEVEGFGTMLFKTYTTEVEVPANDFEIDFDVPATTGKPDSATK